MLYLLDTDHVSLWQCGQSFVVARMNMVAEQDVAVSVLTYEEQLRGRLAVIQKAETNAQLAISYLRLRQMQEFFCAIRIMDFDEAAADTYEVLRKSYRRLDRMDLRIAAVALTQNTILVTRNRKDFDQIEGLPLDDWSA